MRTLLATTLVIISLAVAVNGSHRMNNLNQPYTCGLWTVKPGHEQEFAAAWREFAQWTAQHVAGAGTGYLLQDTQHPERFFSFGPWANTEAIQKWRDTPEFKAFVVKVKTICDDFQPQSMKLAATSDR